MNESEALALIREGEGIDAGQAAHDEAAAAGMLDEAGQIIVPPDPAEAKAAEWFLIPKALAWAISTAMPEVKDHYTDAACMELARAIVPVADKYGISGVGDVPELTLLMATGMFCAPGYLAFKARKAAAEAKARTDKGQGETFVKPINGTADPDGG